MDSNRRTDNFRYNMRFRIEDTFVVVALYFIALGIHNIPFENLFGDLNGYLEKLTPYRQIFFYIFLGVLFASTIRIFFYLKSISRWGILHIVSIVLLVADLATLFDFTNVKVNQHIFALVVTLSYILHRVSNYFQSNSQTFINEPDLFVINRNDDQLNRSGLAKRIFQIINSSSGDTLKIGIYGKWGSGKTSLMHLVSTYFAGEYVVGWFNPWLFNNQKDTWIGFRKSFEEALNRFSSGTIFSIQIENFKYWFLRFFLHSTAKTPLGKLLDELLKSAGTPQQEEIKRTLNHYLERTLPKNTKIVFFIDDLDRVDDAKRVLEILRALKEIVNFKNIYYIISIDDTNVNQMIARELNIETYNFLDKIIDYAITIDEPSEDQLFDYTESLLRNHSDKISSKNIQSIKEYLPSNPRSLKRYLGNLSLLGSITNRFEEDELNINLLYMAQLLKMEYPEVYRLIVHKKNAISLFSYSFKILRAMDDDKTSRDQKLIEEINTIVADSKIAVPNTNRLNELIIGIDKQIQAKDSDILFHFRVIEDAQLLTWKEYSSLISQYVTTSVPVFSKLPQEVRYQYLDKLLLTRSNVLGSIADAVYEDEMENLALNITLIDNQLIDIIEEYNVTYSEYIFKALREQYRAWSHFNSTFYQKIRENERTLLKTLVRNLSETNADKVLADLTPWEEVDLFRSRGDYGQLLKELLEIAEDYYVNTLIYRFQEPEGLDLWGHNQHYLEKWYIFQVSKFHSQDTYSKLYWFANKATEDKVIRNNFYQLFRLFKYYLTDGYTIIERNKIVELVKIDMFLFILWKGVTSSPVNIRMYSSLVEFLQLLESKYGIVSPILLLPDWWEEKKQEYEQLSK